MTVSVRLRRIIIDKIIYVAIVSTLQIKGLFVYASKGFTLRCRIKILHQPFCLNSQV
jgi:hypothetical protein